MTAVASPSATAVLAGVSIVLPCHDEEANVAAAVRMACRAGRMNAQAYEVIVVDDGSRDATNAVATRLAAGDPHVHVVAHPRNRGYGAALRTGIAAAQQPWVLLTDADLQFDLVDLAGFVAARRRPRPDRGLPPRAQRPAPPARRRRGLEPAGGLDARPRRPRRRLRLQARPPRAVRRVRADELPAR